MGRKKKIQPVIIQEENLNENVEYSTKNVVNEITKVENQEEYQKLVSLFNLNQSKKNALRIIKLNGLLDKVEDQVIERFEKRPAQMSNQELLDYLKVVESSIDRSQKYVDKVDDKPMIQINTQTNNINVEVPESNQLDKESKQKVLDLVDLLMKDIQSPQNEEEKSDLIIDTKETIEEGEIEHNDNN